MGKKSRLKFQGRKHSKKRDCRDVFSSVILCGAFCGIPYFRFRKGGGWDCCRIPGACLPCGGGGWFCAWHCQPARTGYIVFSARVRCGGKRAYYGGADIIVPDGDDVRGM